MREIKFRAWDKDSKQWVDGFEQIEMDGEKCFTWDLLEGTSGKYKVIFNDVLPNIELMQFTGLHDSQDKEIFEGDIIQYDYDLHLKYPKEVKYKDGMFRKVSVRQQGWNALYIDIDRYEIIGNIYENPELIAGTQKGPENEGQKNCK